MSLTGKKSTRANKSTALSVETEDRKDLEVLLIKKGIWSCHVTYPGEKAISICI